MCAKHRKIKLQDGASVAEHARRLRARPGWNPHNMAAATNHAEALEQIRVEQKMQQLGDCPDCQKLREETRDPQALCRRHLADLLGF